MSDAQQNRRKGQRVEAKLNLEVSIPRGDGSHVPARMETLNISSSGVYFRSDHYIEPMTKLNMVLDLPVDPQRPEATGIAHCEGIVVRVLPESVGSDAAPYEVAVFFTQIDEPGLRHLQQHINMLLAVG